MGSKGASLGRSGSSVLSSLKEDAHAKDAYRTPFALPENKAEANDIGRYLWRIGPYKSIDEPPRKLIRTTRVNIPDLRSNQETIRKSTMNAFVNQKLDPDSILDNGKPPFVIKSGNTYLIADGHHRASYAKILDRKSLKVNLLDLADVRKELLS